MDTTRICHWNWLCVGFSWSFESFLFMRILKKSLSCSCYIISVPNIGISFSKHSDIILEHLWDYSRIRVSMRFFIFTNHKRRPLQLKAPPEILKSPGALTQILHIKREILDTIRHHTSSIVKHPFIIAYTIVWATCQMCKAQKIKTLPNVNSIL